MFELEKNIKKWRQRLYRDAAFEDGYIAELESHLRDEFDAFIKTGCTEKEAFENAVAAIGRNDKIGAEYFKTDARGFFGLPFWRKKRAALMANYLKLYLRKIRRQKGFSFINIAGLAVGMACCILILTWVQDELGYNRFFPDADRIFRINVADSAGGKTETFGESPSLIGPTLVEAYPEVVNFTRLQSGWLNWHLHYKNQDYTQERLAAADPTFFEVFPFLFIKGDPATALKGRYSIVLTETLAAKLFEGDEPLGKVVQISGTDMKVTGVIADTPANSTIQFDFIFPVINMTRWRDSKLDSWSYRQFTTYVKLQQNVNAEEFSHKIKGIVKENVPNSKLDIFLQPLLDIHLKSNHINNWTNIYPGTGNITYVYLFTLIAWCILLIACINFMNLATARSGTRAREVGLRKVAGAQRKDLIRQFMGEAVLFSTMALLLALVLVELLLPAFNSITQKTLALDYSGNLQLFSGLFGIVLFSGLISGSYPAIYLSSFQPALVLKDSNLLGLRQRGGLRKLLVVGQFAFTIILIIVTTVIYRQLHYIQSKDLGFDKDNIIMFAEYGEYDDNYAAAQSELLQNPNILSTCKAFPPAHNLGGTTQVSWEGKESAEEVMMFSDMGDHDFLKTFGLKMASGRFYSRKFSTDSDSYVINETAAVLMGFADPLGKKLTLQNNTGPIIGVVKDYHGGSLHHPIQPKVIKLRPGFFVCVKFQGNIDGMLSFLQEKWEKFVPGSPFRYRFMDETIYQEYATERRIGKIIQYFTGLAVFVACLGLFGLASFLAERRTKEIGIRKVMGARVLGIAVLLSKEFSKWVLTANIIAWPAAYYIARKWLQGFAYHTSLGLEIFLVSALAALLIAILTVSYQAIKAAIADPIKSLRYE